MITGLFDVEERLEELTESGDHLVKLGEVVDWEAFRPTLAKLHEKERKANSGRKPHDEVLMLKITVLGSLHNLSDDALEFLIKDRLSFMRFLGLGLADRVPDAKTIWLFRDRLRQAGLIDEVFAAFEEQLARAGYAAKKGQIVDATIVSVPVQRNSREVNRAIKEGREIPEQWSEPKARQKDTEARWTRKRNKNYYGYKNHVETDAAHKFIRRWRVTAASVHDSQVFEEILDETNTSREVWADSAYASREREAAMRKARWRPHIQRKGSRGRPLTEREKSGNKTRSRVRSRVEHVFGAMRKRMGDTILRCVGKARATVKIGLRNLAYNMDRLRTLTLQAA
jgi:IS5 family transposase